jgi:uncharacterized UPF0160 family protein
MIYTHSGLFHADDALAVAIVQNYLPIEGISIISRVRELPGTFNSSCDIAVDVGGCYDPKRQIFDHHFKGGSDDGFAAAGKVWQTVELPQALKDRVYLTLIGAIDRADIGISDWSPVKDEWRHLSASALISSMNPPFGSSEEQQRDCFYVVVKTMSLVLLNAVEQAKTWLEMSEVVKTSEKINQVLILTKGGPWQEHVFSQELDGILYAIYPSERGGYCVQCVPNKLGGFGMRKPLPEAWRGLRGAELIVVLPPRRGGWADTSSLFTHPGGFIAGTETFEEAKELALLAVNA